MPSLPPETPPLLPPRPGGPGDSVAFPPVPGRGRPRVELGLAKLRESWFLKTAAWIAFLGYGGLITLVVVGRLPFRLASTVALMSLASWFFLFWWFPVLEQTKSGSGAGPRRRALGAALEVVAIGCVLVVNVLLAIIVTYAARN